jgi:LPS O-antigen subunit length determinant protein (WzzB/FepE family)
MTENSNQFRFDSVDLVQYLWNNRKPLIFITGLAAIVSIVVSLLIDEKYKSEVIVFRQKQVPSRKTLFQIPIPKRIF